MKKLLAFIVAIPALALIGGVGILALRISDTWNASTTQSLVTGLTVVCGGGALMVAILLALIVGIPLAVRIFGETGISHRAWGGGRTAIPPGWDDIPPRLPMRRSPPMIEGEWRQSENPTPPWGVTGGGSPQLLPPPEHDQRFGIDR